MAHGTPDYGITAGRVTTYQLTDLGELAARLGSPVTFDRRGDIIWWDDFECSLNKWNTAISGTGASAAVSTERARNGENSAKLVAGSTGATNAGLTHRQPIPVLSSLGYEISFCAASEVSWLQWDLEIYDGANVRSYLIRWRDDLNELHYYNAAAAFVPFASIGQLRRDPTLFHTAKLVVDALAGQYRYFMLDSTVYSLAGIVANATPTATEPHMSIAIINFGRAGLNDTVYVDDAILTQNEPA